MTPSKKCVDLVKQFEGCKLKAYKCPAGVPTIGIGTTIYPDGRKVQMGDVITMQQAEAYLMHDLNKFASKINVAVNQNQFDALVSFAYNLGTGALNKSTLLKKVKANPNDPTIEAEFMKWVRAGGQVLQGLVKRRQAESDLYFNH